MDKNIEILTQAIKDMDGGKLRSYVFGTKPDATQRPEATQRLRDVVNRAKTSQDAVEKAKLLAESHTMANDLLDSIVEDQRREAKNESALKKFAAEHAAVAALRTDILSQRRATDTTLQRTGAEISEGYRRLDRQDVGTKAAIVTAGVVGVGLAAREMNRMPDGKRERWAPWMKRQLKRVAAGLGILWLISLFGGGGGGPGRGGSGTNRGQNGSNGNSTQPPAEAKNTKTPVTQPAEAQTKQIPKAETPPAVPVEPKKQDPELLPQPPVLQGSTPTQPTKETNLPDPRLLVVPFALPERPKNGAENPETPREHMIVRMLSNATPIQSQGDKCFVFTDDPQKPLNAAEITAGIEQRIKDGRLKMFKEDKIYILQQAGLSDDTPIDSPMWDLIRKLKERGIDAGHSTEYLRGEPVTLALIGYGSNPAAIYDHRPDAKSSDHKIYALSTDSPPVALAADEVFAKLQVLQKAGKLPWLHVKQTSSSSVYAGEAYRKDLGEKVKTLNIPVIAANVLEAKNRVTLLGPPDRNSIASAIRTVDFLPMRGPRGTLAMNTQSSDGKPLWLPYEFERGGQKVSISNQRADSEYFPDDEWKEDARIFTVDKPYYKSAIKRHQLLTADELVAYLRDIPDHFDKRVLLVNAENETVMMHPAVRALRRKLVAEKGMGIEHPSVYDPRNPFKEVGIYSGDTIPAAYEVEPPLELKPPVTVKLLSDPGFRSDQAKQFRYLSVNDGPPMKTEEVVTELYRLKHAGQLQWVHIIGDASAAYGAILSLEGTKGRNGDKYSLRKELENFNCPVLFQVSNKDTSSALQWPMIATFGREKLGKMINEHVFGKNSLTWMWYTPYGKENPDKGSTNP